MSIKQILLNLYNWPYLPKTKVEDYQAKIRNTEWLSISQYIPLNSKLLDVGCGAGYAMNRAQNDRKCITTGIDPSPGAHGVGRYTVGSMEGLKILQGFSEALPFDDESFDVVYSSHVLEHVNDEQKSLQEMKRVLKPEGILIIGMPTASMALINLLTHWMFTTHHRLVNFFLSPFINVGKINFVNLFIPISHSHPRAKTLIYDLCHYRVCNWRKIVSSEFTIEQTILPALYPYPEIRQWFPMVNNSILSSSVFFICRRNK